MVTRRSDPSLPRWATLVPHAPSVGREPVSAVEEEALYVRTRCYHEASRAVDRAWKRTLDRHSTELRAALFHPSRDASDETSVAPPSSRKRARTGGDATEVEEEEEDPSTSTTSATTSRNNNAVSLEQRFTVNPPWANFPRQLLPVHLLSGPSNALDRLAWMQHLVHAARRTTDGAIVWLQRGPPSSWVTELIRQLYILEPPRDTVGLKQLSAMENLERWCRSTQTFRFIQIFLDTQTVQSAFAPINRFLNWLAHVRSTHGIPFSVVLLESSGGHRLRRHDLCSHAQGTDGMVLYRHALATPVSLLVSALSDPLAFNVIPALFQQETANGGASFWSLFESTGSTILALAECKRLLADYLSSPGSFLLLDFEAWMSNRRLDWMLAPDHLQWSRMLKEPTLDLEAWRRQASIKRTLAVVAWQVRHLVVQNCRAHPPTELWNTIADQKRFFVEPVAKTRALVKTNHRTSHVLAPLNELIVLLDNCTSLQEILQCLDFYADDWSAYADSLPLRVPPARRARQSQPRRDLVEGLLVDKDEEGSLGLSSVSGILYSVFDQRLSIGLSEWMMFLSDQPICHDMDASEAVAYFSAGINFLKVQGLIRERRAAGKSDPIFEKTAVVFSSGA